MGPWPRRHFVAGAFAWCEVRLGQLNSPTACTGRRPRRTRRPPPTASRETCGLVEVASGACREGPQVDGSDLLGALLLTRRFGRGRPPTRSQHTFAGLCRYTFVARTRCVLRGIHNRVRMCGGLQPVPGGNQSHGPRRGRGAPPHPPSTASKRPSARKVNSLPKALEFPLARALIRSTKQKVW